MPSGNQAASLYRDCGAIISLGLLLLGAGVTHKHHLPAKKKEKKKLVRLLGAFIGGSRHGAAFLS